MYQERISRVLAAMERMGLEQMLVSDPDSIWYLTGYDVFPFERLYAFYLRKDGQHKLFLNKLFPVPEAPYEQVWFSDTDDYLAILANAVDGEKDMGVDKDWPARFLLPLMAHNPSCKYVLASDCVDDARACKDAVERDLMREANELAESMLRPGVPLCDLDKAARDHISAAGYGEYFTHRLGHFIGQTEHEKGDVSATNTTLAKPGMIFSIEPGVYLPGEFGVRVEDLVVTEDGCEILNHVDKHWKTVG